MPVYNKMEGAGYVVRGPCTHTGTEEVLEDIGEKSFYRKSFK